MPSAGMILCVAMSIAEWSPAHAERALKREDLLWLARITYGIDDTTLAQYRHLGRTRFLDAQLAARDTQPPADAASQIDALEISHVDAATLLRQVSDANQQINALKDDGPKQDARKALNERGNQLASQAARRQLLLAIYSPAQLREQMVWFWLNHFSVFEYKANVRWLVADYEEHAIRAHALGTFHDLVLATLRHPAMLQYLDNFQNATGHINENYARELLELHTLGVHGGYTQQDVQELARILTGVGTNATDKTPSLKPEWQKLYVRDGAFEFNPARHDFGGKTLLGRHFDGGGMEEVTAAVDWITSQPACARFVTGRIAVYFLGTDPSEALHRQLEQTFQRHQGDIAAVLRTLFASREFTASLGKQFKDPQHYVVSALRLAYDGRVITSTKPALNWLNQLGEGPWLRQTPDGYPLGATSWTSSGQMSRRFEIARAIGSGNAGLFQSEDGSMVTRTGFPQIAGRLYFQHLEPLLGAPTRAALEQASSQAEWNTYLLSSPEFNYR